MNIFKRLRDEQKTATATATERYFALIGRIDPDDAADADLAELADVLQATGRTVEQAEADRAKVIDLRHKLAYVADHQNSADVLADAEGAFMSACAERQATFAAMNAKVSAMMAARDQAQHDAGHATKLRGDLGKAKASDPLLFAAAEVADRPATRTKK